MPQHFVASPQWEWYIIWYFFLGGLAGGAYALGTLLRLVGGREDEGAARVAFLVAFPAFAICPILLTLDLGQPVRFWHMLLDGRLRHPLAQRVADALRGGFGRLFMIVGTCLGLFIAGYTGVLLAVSNQPIWSDTWALGALFLASGLSTAAA